MWSYSLCRCGKCFANPTECLGRFVEGPNRATGQRLDGVSDLAQGQSGEAGGAGSTQFHKHAGVDSACAVSGRTDQSAQRLAQPIRHFLSDVLDGIVNGGGQRQRREVSVIYFCLGVLCHHRLTLQVALQVGLYLQVLTKSLRIRIDFAVR